MNHKMIRFMLSKLLVIESLLFAPPIIVAFIYGESSNYIFAFLCSASLAAITAFFLGVKKPKDMEFFIKEGFVLTSLGWILLSFFGALPFFISGAIPSLVDAFFETASGLTTTGASILTDIESLPKSLLFWRSSTHFVGGMGVLVFMLAVLPISGSEGVHIMKAEVPGPAFGKLLSKVHVTARVLYLIYLSMTVILTVLLIIGGMPIFDSILHSFGAAGTGGFGMKSASIGYYNSAYIEIVISFAMILFGVNFNLYYLILMKNARDAFRSEELKWYFGIIGVAFIMIVINLAPFYQDGLKLLRDVFFTVSSIITTTGYSTADFATWPIFSHVILLFLMFTGAMAGSTAGGLKMSRVGIYIKTALAEIKRGVNPYRVVPIKFEGKQLDRFSLRSTTFYFLVYISCFVGLLLIISLDTPDFISAFSAVAATLNNIGPGLGIVGPTESYANFNDFSKIVLSFTMIAGRLEILPIIVLLSPKTWQDLKRSQ